MERFRLKCFCIDQINILNKFEGMFFLQCILDITLIVSSYYRINVPMIMMIMMMMMMTRPAGPPSCLWSANLLHACSSDAYMYILDLWSLFGALTPESQFPITSPPTFMHSVKRERMLSEWSLATSTCLFFFFNWMYWGNMCFIWHIYHNLIPAVGASANNISCLTFNCNNFN